MRSAWSSPGARGKKRGQVRARHRGAAGRERHGGLFPVRHSLILWRQSFLKVQQFFSPVRRFFFPVQQIFFPVHRFFFPVQQIFFPVRRFFLPVQHFFLLEVGFLPRTFPSRT